MKSSPRVDILRSKDVLAVVHGAEYNHYKYEAVVLLLMPTVLQLLKNIVQVDGLFVFSHFHNLYYILYISHRPWTDAGSFSLLMD